MSQNQIEFRRKLQADAREQRQRNHLARCVAHAMECDRKYIVGAWEVVGPVETGRMNLTTGKITHRRDSGYGINAVEPKQFGGVVIVQKGLTKDFAERAVEEHNKGIH